MRLKYIENANHVCNGSRLLPEIMHPFAIDSA